MITARIDKHNEDFLTNLPSVINRVKERFRPDSCISFHLRDTGDGQRRMTREPAEVKEGIANEAAQWFGPQEYHPLGEWKTEFNEREDVDAGIWAGLPAEMTDKDMDEAFASVGLDKAPGDSNLTYRLLRDAGDRCRRALLAIFNTVLRVRRVPQAWKEGVMVLVPKKPVGYAGSANDMRPITLLECASKLFMKVLTTRMMKVLTDHDVLLGARHSVLPGTSTTLPIATLAAAMSQACACHTQLWVYFEDKTKAFDTVLHHILRLALKRLRIPDAFIDLYCDSMLTGRTARIKTEYGLTDPIQMHRGIPQGAVESPLMWAIFYDVLLSRVNRECPGVTLCARKGETSDPEPAPSRPTLRRENGEVIDTTQLAAMAYVDDSAFFAPNRWEMERLL